jgi:hypothetical protein
MNKAANKEEIVMNSIVQQERRTNPGLRAIFDDARGSVEKFFHPDGLWAGESVDYLAGRVLHESHPDLSAADIHILVGAISRRCVQPAA